MTGRIIDKTITSICICVFSFFFFVFFLYLYCLKGIVHPKIKDYVLHVTLAPFWRISTERKKGMLTRIEIYGTRIKMKTKCSFDLFFASELLELIEVKNLNQSERFQFTVNDSLS